MVGLARMYMAATTLCCRAGVHVELVITLLVELRCTDESVSGGRACDGREKGGGRARSPDRHACVYPEWRRRRVMG
jgi:hypothetical protein